jgi:hypothetical protein
MNNKIDEILNYIERRVSEVKGLKFTEKRRYAIRYYEGVLDAFEDIRRLIMRLRREEK